MSDLLTALGAIVLCVLLLLIVFGYSSFLSYVRENSDLCCRILNVLYCQLAVLYQVGSVVQVGEVIIGLWWSSGLPTQLQNALNMVLTVLVFCRAILFLQITAAIIVK